MGSSALVSERGFLNPYCEIKMRHMTTFSLELTRYDILISLMSSRISTLEVQKKALYLKCRKCSFNTLSLPLNMSLFAELQISSSYINRISRTPVFQQIIGIYIDGYIIYNQTKQSQR